MNFVIASMPCTKAEEDEIKGGEGVCLISDTK